MTVKKKSDLLHIVVKFHLLLPQPRNKLLGGDGANLPLLGDNTVEQVCQACQQRLLVPLVLCFIFKHLK